MSVVETEREGVITTFYDEDTGVIREEGSGIDFDFAKGGAQVVFKVAEGVRFITITTPKGKQIVKNIIKK